MLHYTIHVFTKSVHTETGKFGFNTKASGFTAGCMGAGRLEGRGEMALQKDFFPSIDEMLI